MSGPQARVDITANATQAKAEVASFAERVSAASAAVKSSFGSITSSVSAMGNQVKGDLGKVESAIGAVQSRFLAWAAVAAGGKVLKDAVQATMGFTKEAQSLAKVLGINTAEASVLNIALGDIYASADTMTGAAGKLTKQLRTNEDALVAMGIKTRDSSGSFRNMNDILMDSFKVINSYSEGTSRNLAIQTVFGKGAEEVTSLLRLNNQVLDDAKVKQEQLGLTVGVENVEAMKRYRAAMNDVGDVLLAIRKAIGDAVMPMLTKLGEWFSSTGPEAVFAIRGAIGGLVSVFWGLKNAVSVVWQLLDSFVFTIAEPLKSLGEALYKVVQGDFKGAAEVMMSWPDRIGERWSAAWESMVESSTESRDQIFNLFSQSTPMPAKKPAGQAFDVPEKGDTRMSRWEAELDRQKVAHVQMNAENGTFYQFGREREAAYWQAILGTLDASDKQRFAVQRKYFGLVLDLRRSDFEAEQAELLTRIDAARGNFAEQELLAQTYTDRAKQFYDENSKEYQEALRKQQALYRAHRDALLQVDNIKRQADRDARMDDLAALERGAQLERDLGTITQLQLIEVRRRANVMRQALEIEAKQAELAAQKDGPNDPVAVERIQAEIAAIKRKYKGLDGQSNDAKTTEQAKPLSSILGVSESAVQQGLQSMVTRMTVTLGGLRDVAKQIGGSMLQELVTKPMAAWLVSEARRVAMTALFGQQRVALETAATAQVEAVQGASSLKTIAMKAYEAAAGAYSAIAGIPYVGPVLAPVAAGVALAGVLAFARGIFSAEGGFDIPKGMNPLVQTHSNEMILPSRHADTIRMLGDMAQSGSLSASGGGGGPVSITALDARSFERFLAGRQGDQLMRALAKRARNGSY